MNGPLLTLTGGARVSSVGYNGGALYNADDGTYKEFDWDYTNDKDVVCVVHGGGKLYVLSSDYSTGMLVRDYATGVWTQYSNRYLYDCAAYGDVLVVDGIDYGVASNDRYLQVYNMTTTTLVPSPVYNYASAIRRVDNMVYVCGYYTGVYLFTINMETLERTALPNSGGLGYYNYVYSLEVTAGGIYLFGYQYLTPYSIENSYLTKYDFGSQQYVTLNDGGMLAFVDYLVCV